MSDDQALSEAATLKAAELERLARDAEAVADRVESALSETGGTLAKTFAGEGEAAAKQFEAAFRETGGMLAKTLAGDGAAAADQLEATFRETGGTLADALASDGEGAAERLESAFRQTGEGIADTLMIAAQSGELSFNAMVESILQDLARLALERLVIDPVNNWTDQLGSTLAQSIGDVIGQRAGGGPVLAGAPYLVGEQGPEVFVPSSAGAVAPMWTGASSTGGDAGTDPFSRGAPASPTQIIHVTVNAAAEPGRAVQHSERQISAAIARAAAAGGRLL